MNAIKKTITTHALCIAFGIVFTIMGFYLLKPDLGGYYLRESQLRSEFNRTLRGFRERQQNLERDIKELIVINRQLRERSVELSDREQELEDIIRRREIIIKEFQARLNELEQLIGSQRTENKRAIDISDRIGTGLRGTIEELRELSRTQQSND